MAEPAVCDFDTRRLADWLGQWGPGPAAPLAIDKFPGGQSNPTYRIEAGSKRFVLRRKPFGDLLPSAHAVDREHRLLSALHPAGFPVPRPIGLCEDPDVIGAIFYVMELVDGRTFWKGTLPDQSPAERRGLYEAMIGTLGRLHAIAPDAVGLGDFGRPGNYFARQVDRWTRQYRASQTEDIPEVERLIEWLPGTLPEQSHSAIIHGDYRIDNLIYAPGASQVAAVIDWELTTIGDPIADFAYLMMNWIMPVDDRSGLEGTDFVASGIPSLEEASEIYCAAAGRSSVPDLRWYFAFNLFRLTGIVQGVKKRMLEGNASNANAAASAALLMPLARAAWRQAELAGA